MISRLEDETSTAKDEAEKAAENRIRYACIFTVIPYMYVPLTM